MRSGAKAKFSVGAIGRACTLLLAVCGAAYGCASSDLDESKYPKKAIANADDVVLDPGDVPLGDDYRNQGVVAGSSCKDQASAERMLRLEAAKRGANKVVRFECGTSFLMGCSVNHQCKGKAIATPAAPSP